MDNLNSKKILVFTLLTIILFLMSALVSSLFLTKELRNNNDCKSLPVENNADLEGVLESGTIGETEIDKFRDNPLPPIIFNTSGVIVEIKSDQIIIVGNGSNFNDEIPRELSIIFSNDTIVFVSGDQKIKYEGLGGLQNLKVGDEILVSGKENIRGKTEFKGGTIKVLQ